MYCLRVFIVVLQELDYYNVYFNVYHNYFGGFKGIACAYLD